LKGFAEIAFEYMLPLCSRSRLRLSQYSLLEGSDGAGVPFGDICKAGGELKCYRSIMLHECPVNTSTRSAAHRSKCIAVWVNSQCGTLRSSDARGLRPSLL
jgi:hypothetical protein